MARYAGSQGRVMISTTSAGAAVAVASLSEWSLNMTRDRFEVTGFGDANKTYVLGKQDRSGSFSGFFDDSDDRVFEAAEATEAVNVYLYPSTDALGIYFYGTAFLDASITVPTSGAIAISGNFVAAGSWGRVNS